MKRSKECILDRLFPLSFANLWLHVTFSQDICEGGAHNGTLELLRTPCPLLRLLLLLTLLVFTPERQIAPPLVIAEGSRNRTPVRLV